MSAAREPLFTPRFFAMCGFTFTVFLSVFQLIPTAPFHVRALGGGALASGLFLGLLTFASAWSAPLTGAVADRVGRSRVLVGASLALAGFTAAYAVIPDYRWLLALVLIHGIVWSSLLSASAAYMTGALPAARRAEGIAYWGLSSVTAMAVAPSLGFWMYARGWIWLCAGTTGLNLLMAFIASRLPDDRRAAAENGAASPTPHHPGGWIEHRVLILATPLFLYAFGYGSVSSFSAVYTTALGVRPTALYLTVLAAVALVTRPILGTIADRAGYRRVFIPCLLLMAVGLAILPFARSGIGLAASAAVFALGFGTSYPIFAAYALQDVHEWRRGAAFGAILAAFDTGIGAGSTVSVWLIVRAGFATAFGVAAVLAALALPVFLLVDRWFGPGSPGTDAATLGDSSI
jgi:MFS family permease